MTQGLTGQSNHRANFWCSQIICSVSQSRLTNLYSILSGFSCELAGETAFRCVYPKHYFINNFNLIRYEDKHLFSLAALSLMVAATLTSCEDILGHWERPTAVTPSGGDAPTPAFDPLATTLELNCYEDMFNGCTALTTAWVKAGFKNSGNECTSMFYNVVSGTLYTGDKSSWEAGGAAASARGGLTPADWTE